MPSRPLVFAALADDITGAMELASLLVRRGVRCGFVTTPERAAIVRDRVDAIVLAQKTRVIPSAQAVAAFERGWAALRPARQFFFKYCATFDSTSHGNIGPCADLLMERTGARFTIFCPTFPEAGRFVFQGHLFVGDRLVSESPKRFDPLTPMTDPDLVRVLASQTRRKVGLLPFYALQSGRDIEHIARLMEAGVHYAVADSSTEADLARISLLTVEWPLMTGGSSIADHYPELWRTRGWIGQDQPKPNLPSVQGPGVVLSGSCSDVTLGQLANFAQTRPMLTLDITAGDEKELTDQALGWAMARVSEGPVAIATSAPPDEVRRAQAVLGMKEASEKAERVLGALAPALKVRGVRRFVIAGGETSGAILASLGIEELEVGPYEQAGMAKALARTPELLALSLKSGKLGPPDMLLRMLDSMRAGG